MSLAKFFFKAEKPVSCTITSKPHYIWYPVTKSLFKCLFFRSVTAQLPGPNGYGGGKVIFIDTEVKHSTTWKIAPYLMTPFPWPSLWNTFILFACCFHFYRGYFWILAFITSRDCIFSCFLFAEHIVSFQKLSVYRLH